MSDTINKLFPVFIKLEEKNILIVGGGAIAMEKITAVLNNSPATRVKLVASSILSEIKNFTQNFPNVQLIERDYNTTDLEGIHIAIVATGNRALSEKIKNEAAEKNILANVADTPDLCDFYLGSIITKGELKIAISTNGKSPTLAKRLRQYLEKYISNDVLVSIDSLNKLRNSLKGDFAFKVKKLNEATEILLSERNLN